MRASWTTETHPGASQRPRAAVDDGYSEAGRAAGALVDRLGELLDRLSDLPPDSFHRPSDG